MDTTVSELVYSVCRETFTGVSSIRKKEWVQNWYLI